MACYAERIRAEIERVGVPVRFHRVTTTRGPNPVATTAIKDTHAVLGATMVQSSPGSLLMGRRQNVSIAALELDAEPTPQDRIEINGGLWKVLEVTIHSAYGVVARYDCAILR
jgi:hypothetical protein